MGFPRMGGEGEEEGVSAGDQQLRSCRNHPGLINTITGSNDAGVDTLPEAGPALPGRIPGAGLSFREGRTRLSVADETG